MSGCSDDADPPVEPVVDQIDDALDAVDERYDQPPEYFEVSANLVDVRLVVAEDLDDGEGTATAFSFRDGTLTEPESLGTAQGNTFASDAVTLDPDSVFDGIRTELGDVLITDLAVVGAPSGTTIYDATVRSDKGGQLRVRLDGDGGVLEVMAE